MHTLSESNHVPNEQGRPVLFCSESIFAGNEDGALRMVATSPDSFAYQGWVAIFGLFAFAGYAASTLSGLPLWLTISAAGVVYLAVLFAARRMMRPARAPAYCPITLTGREPAGPGVRVIAPDLHHAAAVGTDREEVFEPKVFRLYLITPERKGESLVVYLCSLLATVLTAYLLRGVAPVVWKIGYFQFITVAFVAALPLFALWPTYLRLTPGRMELIRYGVLGQGPARITEWLLRDATAVRIDLRIMVVTVNGGVADQPEPRPGLTPLRNDQRNSISFRFCASRFELVRAVLDAATSPELAPRPTRDGLGG